MKSIISLPKNLREIQLQAREIALLFDREYWITKVEKREHPQEMWEELADAGLLGLSLPESVGGAGFGFSATLVVAEEMAAHGFPLLQLIPSTALVFPVLAGQNNEVHISDWLVPAMRGEKMVSFSITEPNTGSNIFKMETSAKPSGDGYVLNGKKVFCSGAGYADRIFVLCRTTKFEDSHNASHGFSFIMIDPNAPGVTIEEADTVVPVPEKQYNLTFENVVVPKGDVIGDIDGGLQTIFPAYANERLIVSALAAGLSRFALDTAVDYVSKRSLFGVPTGSHQGVQFPLARAHSLSSAAWAQTVAVMLSAGSEKFNIGESDMAHLAAVEALGEAANASIQVMGATGFTRSKGLEDVLQISALMRMAPANREMILSGIGTRILGLPQSH